MLIIFRTHLYCPYTSAEDKVQCCVEKKHSLELRQVFPQDPQILDPPNLVASAPTKAPGAAALLPLSPASMPQKICSPPMTHKPDLDGNYRDELTIDEIQEDGPCYTSTPPSSDVANSNPLIRVNSDPDLPIPDTSADGRTIIMPLRTVKGAAEKNDFPGGGPGVMTINLDGDKGATRLVIWGIDHDSPYMGPVFNCSPESTGLFC